MYGKPVTPKWHLRQARQHTIIHCTICMFWAGN